MNKCLTLLVIMALLVSCKNNSDDNDQRHIDINAILDMSGHYSQFGTEARDALRMMSDMNENLYIKYYDSRGLSAVADSILDSIIARKEEGNVVTLSSWISNDLAEKIAQHNLLQFPIGSAAFSKSNLMSSVLMTERVEHESPYLIDYLSPFNKIAILYFNNDFGTTWFHTLSDSLGSKVVASEAYTDTQTDFTAELSGIALTNPDVIVLISTREAAMILHQANQLGLHTRFCGTRVILTNELLAEPAADSLVFSYPKIDYSHYAIKEFQLKYGYKPGSFSAESIDLCLALINAADQNKYSRDDVFGFLKNNSLTGSFYNIQFDDMCRANYGFALMRVKNGSFTEMK